MNIARHIAIVGSIIALAIPQASIASPQPFSGQIIVAQNSENPVLIWQASRELYTMVGDGVSDQDINNQLAHDALRAVAAKLKNLISQNGRLSLKIMYNKMTANGLNYAVFTLADASEYADIEMPLRDARKNRDKWMSLSAQSKIPAWIHYRVVGKLPGR